MASKSKRATHSSPSSSPTSARRPREARDGRDGLCELYAKPPDQVKLYVDYLGRKLGPRRTRSAPIETVRGFGYRYRMINT